MDSFEGFLSQIVVMLPAFRAIEERLDRETGRSFNVFDFFGANETSTSRALCYLLDPKAGHGQESIFLRLFMERFVPEWANDFHYERAEPAKIGEHADLVISDGQHWLGIENKIFSAREQEKQVDRYLEALRIKLTREEDDYRLLYLSPKGEPPSVYSYGREARDHHHGKFVLGGWIAADATIATLPTDQEPSLPRIETCLEWLTDCEKNCRADNVRWSVRHFHQAIVKSLAPQEEFNMTGSAIVGLAMHSANNLDAALRIGDESVRIKAKVLSKLLSEVRDGLLYWISKKNGAWELEHEWNGGNWIYNPTGAKYCPLLLRKKNWPSMVGAAISNDRSGPAEVFVGAMAPTQVTWNTDKESKKYYGNRMGFIDETQRQEIAERIGQVPPEAGWWIDSPLLRYDGQDFSNWNTTDMIVQIYRVSDQLARHIVNEVTMLAEKMDGCFPVA